MRIIMPIPLRTRYQIAQEYNIYSYSKTSPKSEPSLKVVRAFAESRAGMHKVARVSLKTSESLKDARDENKRRKALQVGKDAAQDVDVLLMYNQALT